MRYAKMFGKTINSVSQDIQVPSHRWLVQGGFIRESVAGRYFFLPLGMRVRHKLMQIIRAEMDGVGGLEMMSPTLHPLALWQETNRDNAANFGLMQIEDRRGARFALAGTAEEMFVDVVRKFQLSYKDLPLNIYQFSQKFRDELRARGGLLRVREFTMKDAYTFDQDEAAFAQTYETMRQTYTRIFRRVGLNPVCVPADNGYIGGEYSHEFVIECPVGETHYLMSEGGAYCAHQDVATFALTAINPHEAEAPLQMVEQPKWVKSIADLKQHYDLPAARFLKSVAYKNTTTGELIIAVIRGDLEVNQAKLEHVTGAIEQLTAATAADLRQINTRPGYVRAWGHSGVRTIGDTSLTTVKNFIGGQKTDTHDAVNVNYERDFVCDQLADIALAQPGYQTTTGHRLAQKRGIEIGHIFQLADYYSSRMAGATFINQAGSRQPYYMGCYGIGLERTLQAVAEIHRDAQGLIWPKSVAPFHVHLIHLNCPEKGEALYHRLTGANIEVLYDDRVDVSAGGKLTDADIIGCPVRLVVSKRTGDQVEWKLRSETQSVHLPVEGVLQRLNGA